MKVYEVIGIITGEGQDSLGFYGDKQDAEAKAEEHRKDLTIKTFSYGVEYREILILDYDVIPKK